MSITIPSSYYGLPTDGGLWNENAIFEDSAVNAAVVKALVQDNNYLVAKSAKKVAHRVWADPDVAELTYYGLDQRDRAPETLGIFQAGSDLTTWATKPLVLIPFPTSANCAMVRVRVCANLSAAGSNTLYFGTLCKPFASVAECPYSLTVSSTTMGWIANYVDIPVFPGRGGEFLALYAASVDLGGLVDSDNIDLTDYDDPTTDPDKGTLEVKGIGAGIAYDAAKIEMYDNDATVAKDSIDGCALCFRDYDANIISVAGIVQWTYFDGTGTRFMLKRYGTIDQARAYLASLPADDIYSWAAYNTVQVTVASVSIRELESEEA